MSGASKPARVVAIEEHFWSPAFATHFSGRVPERPAETMQRMEDFFDLRLAEMDEAGIDVQVISHAPPGGQRLKAETAVEACRNVNDELAAAIAKVPRRFAGFATLPTADPAGAADELQRSVEELGFTGAMLFGLSDGRFVDEEPFWPIYARAAQLGVPIYMHPAMPHPAVTDIYYGTYAKSHPSLVRAAWGFGVETGTLGIRMVLSGVFDRYPDLQIILGHLGEGIPFQLSRIDEALSRPGNAPTAFAETFRKNFYVTTSGFFSDSALRCCIEELGVERILFAIDWPFVPNPAGVDWLKAFQAEPAVKDQIFAGNADRLLGLKQ